MYKTFFGLKETICFLRINTAIQGRRPSAYVIESELMEVVYLSVWSVNKS